MSAASTRPASPAAPTTSPTAPKRVWTTVSRGSERARSRAASTACGSRSIASTRPSEPMRSSTARVCPPRPNVQSMYAPPGRGAIASITSSSMTGTCSDTWAPRGVPHRSLPATGARRRIPGARSREEAAGRPPFGMHPTAPGVIPNLYGHSPEGIVAQPPHRNVPCPSTPFPNPIRSGVEKIRLRGVGTHD